MHLKPYLQSILILILLFTISCVKNNNGLPKGEIKTGEIGQNEVVIMGTVLEEDGAPAVNINVNVDGRTLFTDNKGVFKFQGEVSNTDKVVIKATAQDHFDNIQTLVVEKGGIYKNFKIFTRQQQAASSFLATSGGTVTSNVVSLTFDANSFLKPDGSVYSGIVSVNISAPNSRGLEKFKDQRGTDASGAKVVIWEFGFFSVLLKGQSGETLKLSKPYKYVYNPKTSPYENAPKAPKTWVYNYSSNEWGEVGSATTTSQKTFTGNLKDLGDVIFGKPYPRALLRVDVRDKSMSPASNLILTAINLDVFLGGQFSSEINSNGIALMYAPAGTKLKLIVNNACNDYVYFQEIPEVTPNSLSKQSFTVDLSSYYTAVKGKVIDCSFKAFEGTAELDLGGTNIYSAVVHNGEYFFNVLTCDQPNGVVRIFDKTGKLVSQPTSAFYQKGVLYEMPDISTCNLPLKATISVTANGENYSFTTPADNIFYNQNITNSGGILPLLIQVLKKDNTSAFELAFYPGNIGAIKADFISINMGNNKQYYYNAATTIGPGGDVTITKYKNGSTFLEGTFKIAAYKTYTPNINNPTTDLTGSFTIGY
jgi:hypothetical protein